MRTARRARATKETDIVVELSVDGTGTTDVSTGIPFFDHMLAQLGRHGGFDLTVRCTGDLHIDTHHTIEDVGIAIGEALREALGDKAGVRRFASIAVPLDEALIDVAIDLSGRPFLVYEVDPSGARGRRSCSAIPASTLSWPRSSGAPSPWPRWSRSTSGW